MTSTPLSQPPGTATAPPPAVADGLLGARAKATLVLLCAAQLIISLDFSILNVALPVLGHDLRMGQGDLQWAITAFALPSGGLLLLFGRIADLVGRRRMFLGGLVLFTLASVLATVAWDVPVFLLARALQGVGAAAVVPTGMALLTTTFPEGPARNTALAVNGTLLSLGYTVGMLLGGGMTDQLGWRSTMALPACAGALLAVAAPLLLAESRPAKRPRLDVLGAVCVTGGLLLLIYGLSTAVNRGFSAPAVYLPLALGVLFLGAFVAVEWRVPDPLVSMRMLRRPTVALGNLGGLTTFSMMSSTIFLLTLYLQQVLGLSAFRTSLVFGAQGVVLAVTGLSASKIVGVLGSRTTLVAGLAVQSLCTALLLGLSGHHDVWLALAALTLGSVGHMSAVVSYGITATSGLPDHEQGLATGLVTSAQQIGITIGIPVLSALAAGRSEALQRAGRSIHEAMVGGTRLGAGVDAAFVLVAATVIGLGLARGARRPVAER